MQIPVEKEAKKKAVKTKQIDFEGKPVKEKSDDCVFCSAEVDEAFANLARAAFGDVVCQSCLIKMMRIICFAGTREFQ
jgi:hypothetical protein